MNAKHSNSSSEHITPIEIVEAARATMSGIHLDPASSYAANRLVIRARLFYTEKQNGFRQAWSGPSCWLNPPGGYADPNGVCSPRDPVTGKQKRRPGDVSAPKLWFRKLVQHFVLGHLQQFAFECFSNEQLSTLQTMDDPYPNVQGLTASGRRYDFWWCILRERPQHLVYIGDDQLEAQRSPTHTGAIVYAGKNGKRFEKEFRHLGAVGRLR